ncbi:MAG: response regulator transcription factor [Deltaproteobacteria bacterium]|nr:response regulator transcription factor [Deltaproteobacteria bacterium]MBP7287378.1 response regulator transcription factor [Nannocystaceae bacterium]
MTPSSPKSTTVLVIEDDDAIRQGLVDALEFEGYPVVQAATAPRGLQAAIEGAVGLVLLDLMLPGGDGFEVLKEVRRTRSGLPVIILTARGREADRVQGLRLGADDYVVKPFSVKELLARVEAVLRRVRVAGPEPAAVTEVAIPGGTIDLARREVRFDDGARVELSERESQLVGYLVGHAERAVGRDELLQQVWRLNPSRYQTRTIDMHVARLREKLRDTHDEPRVILTVRGKGYMFGSGGA